jgi:hypothetical protein
LRTQEDIYSLPVIGFKFTAGQRPLIGFKFTAGQRPLIGFKFTAGVGVN